MSRFDKYVLKLIAIPLMVSLIVATALLLLDEILRSAPWRVSACRA